MVASSASEMNWRIRAVVDIAMIGQLRAPGVILFACRSATTSAAVGIVTVQPTRVPPWVATRDDASSSA